MFALRFVSCCRPPISPLAFQELTNVFDEKIWLLLLATLIILVLYKNVIVGRHKLQFFINTLASDTLPEFLKLLVNQGDIFFTRVKEGTIWRLPFGLPLLTSAVVSNAYLNKNVYNMVKPREPVPYETFDQLIHDNFNIYSRIAQFDFDFAK